jgi:hypothetical protein
MPTDDTPIIAGFMTTDHIDDEKEVVQSSGCDTASFLAAGAVTWNFHDGPDDVIGYPIAIEERTTEDGVSGLWLTARLIDNKRSRQVIELLKALPAHRPLGLGIAGVITEQMGNEIRHCRVHSVSITHDHTNPHTTVCLIDTTDSIKKEGTTNAK